ncbi:hypothetical protein G5V58_02270 [Nocardioides anomalus]|uniref:DUF3558 domain-containing protein n=1 Tax=Nocardioides anomalus TaxID=2712223 RepID=A0A6G6W8U3_9ACTN|nr:hypothetical protein [Nocardioides anomalus]QIG41758.1 hypothetical protein G5V58_02270 [Nocardioides anomalus]
MKHALVTAGTLLLLAVPLAACGDDDPEPAAAASESASPSAASTAAEVELPSLAPELPRSAPGVLAPDGVTFDACTVTPPDVFTAVFGASAGQAMPQPSSFDDPSAADCFYYGGDVLVAVQATTRADEDMPADSYTYEALPGAVEVPDADRGWAVVLPGQEGEDTVVSGLILVKGDHGLNISLSITGHPYDTDALLEYAGRVLEAM